MSLVSCHVQKYSQNKDGYTEYFILVLYQGREWAIRKRYSDFSKFDEYLRSSGYNINFSLPEKNWWNKFDPTLLSKRLKELQNYLDVLLKEEMSAQNSLVREFLEVDENMLAMAKKQSFKEITYADRMLTIVKLMRKAMIGIPSHRESLTEGPSNWRINRDHSKYHYHQDSPGGTPRQRSKEKDLNSSQHGGSFSGAFGGVLRVGIGSFSGNGNNVDAALAVADAARREAFHAHTSHLWLLIGKQAEFRLFELQSCDTSLPLPLPPVGEFSSQPQHVLDTLGEYLETDCLANQHTIVSDIISENLPRNRITFLGPPSLGIMYLSGTAPDEVTKSPISSPKATNGSTKLGKFIRGTSGYGQGAPSPTTTTSVGRNQLRRINSEGGRDRAASAATVPRAETGNIPGYGQSL